MLRIHVPLQVLRELEHNLSQDEKRDVWDALDKAVDFRVDYSPAPAGRAMFWQERGAKKGDAVIIAQLEAAEVRYFVSENRHVLTQLPALPFEVMDAAAVLRHFG